MLQKLTPKVKLIVSNVLVAGYLFYNSNAVAAQQQSEFIVQLIDQSINFHPSIKAKQLSLGTFELEKKAAILKFLPNVSYIKANTGGTGGSIAIAGSNFVSVNLPLFTGGASIYGLKKANVQISAAELQLLETTQEVSLNVVTAYSDFVRWSLKYEATVDYIKKLRDFERLIKSRFNSGVAPLNDVRLVESRIIQADSDTSNFQANQKLALVKINSLTGVEYDVHELSKRRSSPLVLKNLDTILERAIDNDPYPRRMKLDVEIAELDAKLNDANNYPQVFATAQRQIGNQDIYNTTGQNFYGITIQFNSSQGFSGFVSSAAAYNRAKFSEKNVESILIDHKIKLVNELNIYETTTRKRLSLIENSRIQEQLLQSTYRQYEVGKKSWMDLMNAIRDYYNANLVIADSEADMLNISWKFAVRTSEVK